MLFYTYSAPGMLPGRLAALVTDITPAIGGWLIGCRDAGGFRCEHFLADRDPCRSVRLVCPD